MNAATISLIANTLQVILSIVPSLTSSASINKVIATLINLIPVIEQEAKDLLGPIQNIIAALSANSAATADQLATLKALDTQVDAAFANAVSAYLANHPAPAAPANPQPAAAAS